MKLELDNLEYELKQMLDNIERVRDYADSLENEKYKPYQSLVVGELKHRCVVLKSTLTRVGKIRTGDLWIR